MTEQEYVEFVRAQRIIARLHVEERLLELRARLWPRPPGVLFWEDPIDREDRRRRDAIYLAVRRSPVVNDPAAAFRVIAGMECS